MLMKSTTELMEAQLDEARSRTELNKALTRESEKKSQFWDRAISGLANNSVILEVRNSSELVNYFYVELEVFLTAYKNEILWYTILRKLNSGNFFKPKIASIISS